MQRRLLLRARRAVRARSAMRALRCAQSLFSTAPALRSSLLRLLGPFAGQRLVVLPIVRTSDVGIPASPPLLGPSRGFSRGPRLVASSRPGRSEADVETTFPALCSRTVHNALVDGRSAGVIVDERHIVTDWTFELLDRARLKGVSLLDHDETHALHALPRRPVRIPTGVHLAGYHPQNWYHWIAEILPVVSLLDAASEPVRSAPLLVPRTVAEQSTFREVLVALSGARSIIALPDDGAVEIGELHVIDSPVRFLPGFGDGTLPSTAFDLWHWDAMVAYRARLRDALGVRDGIEPGLRLFIDRNHDPERAYNRDEVLEVVLDRGFTAVVGGDMSLREQVELFARAELMIGSNGAGWTNVMFASPGARALCWVVEGGEGGSWFRNLGALAGVDVRHLVVENRSPEAFNGNPLRADYHVPLDELSAALDGLIDEVRTHR